MDAADSGYGETCSVRIEGADASIADILAELTEVRDSLRDGEGRRSVCTDDVLEEIARRLPVRMEDLAAIPGIGQRFTEQYGEAFLEVSRRYSAIAAGGTEIRCETAAMLRDLEKNLTDLGRGNRMLFQSRMYANGSLDLTEVAEADVPELLFRNGTVSTEGSDDQVRRHAVEIVREASRELRDKGRFDLYVAYPFVEGKLKDGFSVRAPLALFPVSVQREKGITTVSLDPSKEPIFNGTLVLAHMRASSTDGPLPECTVEDASEEGFGDCMLEFYRSVGMDLGWSDREPVRFKGGEPERMRPYADGELEVVPFAVLGRYPLYSGSVQKDFASIIAGNAVSGILDTFVSRPRAIETRECPEIRESDVAFAGPLDSAQERIIAMLDTVDGLVIHGPPGTGKSQVIAEAMVSAAMKGRNVLLVSEKKTALDVVYSRLGVLSDYCIMVDDASDKDAFYSQLNHMLSLERPEPAPGLEEVNSSIERALGKLDAIDRKFYRRQESGLEPSRLYEEDLERKASGKEFDPLVRENVSSKTGVMDYSEVAEMHALFSDPAKMDLYRRYKEIAMRHPILLGMRENLTKEELAQMAKDIVSLSKQHTEYDKALRRASERAKEENAAASVISKYFSRYNRDISDAVLHSPDDAISALDDYWTYVAGSAAFGNLDWPWKSYGNGILELSSATGQSMRDCEMRMFEVVESAQTERFDSSFDPSEMLSFDQSAEEAESLMAEKRGIVRLEAENILYDRLSVIKESRRFSDISRISGSRRRWSPGRFVGRFGYELLGGIRIWLMTPEAVSEMLPLEMGLFDLLIFDEASQMYVEKGVPSMFRAKRVAVAGDPKQLRPSSLGTGRYGADPDGAESLLDMACSRFETFLLDHHYRSRYQALIAFSDRAFYGGKLRMAPDATVPDTPPIEVRVTDGIWEDRCNRTEAEEVVRMLKEILNGRRNGETVGVITFNSAQRDLVNDMLDDECASDPAFGRMIAEEMLRTENGEDVGLFIKNIESVQGDERDIILFSVGYGKNREGKFMQRFGWLSSRGGENRLNVAITRAKERMVIVRSFDPEDIRSDGTFGGPEVFKRFMMYADAVSSGDLAKAEAVLSCFGVRERRPGPKATAVRIIEDRLRAIGSDVSSEVGIDGCGVDLVVRCENGRPLGIELDSSVYGTGEDSRSRDCLRRRFLRARGWDIVRLWTPMVWRNPSTEASRLLYAKTGNMDV